MVKVKTLYHFLDTEARKSRLQGEEFMVSREGAMHLSESGVVAIIDNGLIEKEEKPKRKGKKRGI